MSRTNISKEHRDKAEAAVSKTAALGTDIDLSKFTNDDADHISGEIIKFPEEDVYQRNNESCT